MRKTIFGKNIVRLVLGTFIFFFTFLFVGCAKTAGEDIFRFEVRELSMIINEKQNLKLVLGTIEDKEISLTITGEDSGVISLVKNVIKTNEKVEVTAIKEGTVLLTASVNGEENISDTITITVSKEKLTAMTAVPEKDELYVSETTQFTITTYPLGKIEDNSVIYTSSDEKIGVISETGLFTAKGVGTVIITATSVYDPTIKVMKEMTVLYNDSTDITVLEDEKTLYLNDTYQINATVLPNEYPLFANQHITYTSSNEEVATVTDDGLVTAKSVGEASIKLTSVDGIIKEVNVTVIYAQATGIEVDEVLDVEYKKTLTIKANILPVNANPSLTYISNNEEVATVNEKGVITGVSVGETTITIKSVEGIEKIVTVRVKPVYKITIGVATVTDGGTIAKAVNSEHEITITSTPEKELNFSYEVLNDDSIDVIKIEDNKVICLAKGEATLKIVVDGYTYTITFKVN